MGRKKIIITVLLCSVLLIALFRFNEKFHHRRKTNLITLRIAAAASMINVVQAVNAQFERRFPDVTIESNFAATSLIARQVEHGAPVDVVLSASEEWMTYLATKGAVDSSSIIPIARNVLVWVLPVSSSLTSIDREVLNSSRIQRIAVADWRHVPAGKYARLALEKMGIWQDVLPKLVATLDVRAALAYVEQGNAEVGMVYRSDAQISSKVKTIAISDKYQPEILYEAARVNTAPDVAQRYLQFWQTPVVDSLLTQYGFIPVTAK